MLNDRLLERDIEYEQITKEQAMRLLDKRYVYAEGSTVHFRDVRSRLGGQFSLDKARRLIRRAREIGLGSTLMQSRALILNPGTSAQCCITLDHDTTTEDVMTEITRLVCDKCGRDIDVYRRYAMLNVIADRSHYSDKQPMEPDTRHLCDECTGFVMTWLEDEVNV